MWREWNSIKVGAASDGYQLHMSGRNSKSTLPDRENYGMSQHFNMRFTTYDRDQDIEDKANCATHKNSVMLAGGIINATM